MTSTPMLTEAVSGGTLTDPCPLTLTVGTPSAMPDPVGVAISSCAIAIPPTALAASNPANARDTASVPARRARNPRCRAWGMSSLLSVPMLIPGHPVVTSCSLPSGLAAGSPQAVHPAQTGNGDDEPGQREGEGELRQAQPGRLGVSRCRRVGIGCRRLGTPRESRSGCGDRLRH